MNQKTLFKIALISSILGVLSLFLITELVEIPVSSVKQAEYLEDTDFRITGVVKSIHKSEKFMTITIETTDQITLTSFETLNFKTGDAIDLIGEVNEYKGKKGFVVKEVLNDN